MNIEEAKKLIKDGALNDLFNKMTVSDQSDISQNRWLSLIEKFKQMFGQTDISGFSAPGRSEIGGNHTDHQWGRVLAAAVNLDTIAVAAKNDSKLIHIFSKGYSIAPVDISDLSIRNEEIHRSEALIRGICAEFTQRGYIIGGFNAVIDSAVLPGSGMSSSAAFEVLIGQILSGLFNKQMIDPQTLAMIGQSAENIYFKKPCGLMDQMASAVGGFVFIDFYDPKAPVVEKISLDLDGLGYTLCLTDTGGSHENLSDAYGLMPAEMKKVAGYFNQPVLSRITSDQLIHKLPEVRTACGDRACLRAIHFLKETERVILQKQALINRDIHEFLRLVIESGQSSYMYLQNVYMPSDIDFQPLAVALALSQQFLPDGAYRVHGGGLAGTIQAFVPKHQVSKYVTEMEKVFGKNSTYTLAIRPIGSVQVF